MKRFAVGIGMWICAAAVSGAEPAGAADSVNAAAASSAPAKAVPAIVRPEPAKAATPPAASPTRPLDLRVGDLRKYMTPEDYRALSAPQVDEANTVVVTANSPLLPMKSALDVPGGIIAPFWALANPHKAWRLFLPDPRVNIKEIPPTESKIPPPEFRWGP